MTADSETGLILCDPPLRSVRTGPEYRDEYAVKTSSYQGGYVDFVPQAAQIRIRNCPRSGPPRTSMLDDLVFYLQTHAAALIPSSAAADGSPVDLTADPDVVVGTFVRKLIASHYHKHAEHLRAVLSAAQRALSRKHDLAKLPMERVEELWSDIQASERRMGEYCEDLEGIMLQLGIPLKQASTAVPGYHAYSSNNNGGQTPGQDMSSSSSSPSGPFPRTPTTSFARVSDAAAAAAAVVAAAAGPNAPAYRWLDGTADFQFLLMRFRELRHRTECLNAAVTGLASITGNRQAYKEQQLALAAARRSIREAKSSKAVTLLGLIFIPLAYTSQVYSMSQPYGPGGELFWQYFVASVPLIFVVLGVYYVLDVGYSDDGGAWSYDRFVAAVRGKFWPKTDGERTREDEVVVEGKRPDSP